MFLLFWFHTILGIIETTTTLQVQSGKKEDRGVHIVCMAALCFQVTQDAVFAGSAIAQVNKQI